MNFYAYSSPESRVSFTAGRAVTPLPAIRRYGDRSGTWFRLGLSWLVPVHRRVGRDDDHAGDTQGHSGNVFEPPSGVVYF
jgi:hypothetical protein